MEGEKYASSYIKISIIDTDIKADKLIKHTLYSISGEDSSGSFACLRRYKEFSTLRNILVLQWPGFYIPQIPPKQMIVKLIQGNLHQDFIQIRRKLLDYFLKEVARFEYLYSSEAFQSFVRGPLDYLKPANDLKVVNFIQIGQKLLKIFPDSSSLQITQEIESQLEDASQYFKTGLDALEKFEIVCKSNLENFSNLHDEVKNLMVGLKDVSLFYADKYGGIKIETTNRELNSNPYEELLYWIRTDILDFRAIIESIIKRQDHIKIKVKVEEKLEEEKSKLSKIQSGKKSLGQMFSKKTKEDHISEAESGIKHYEEEIESINLILSIVTKRLLNELIPEFKETKTKRFETIMRHFTEISIKEFNGFVMEARELESKLS
jgi:sorting nexin-1/2